MLQFSLLLFNTGNLTLTLVMSFETSSKSLRLTNLLTSFLTISLYFLELGTHNVQKAHGL